MASELDGLFVRCVVRGVIVLALCARVLRDVTARALSPAAHTRTLSTARQKRLGSTRLCGPIAGSICPITTGLFAERRTMRKVAEGGMDPKEADGAPVTCSNKRRCDGCALCCTRFRRPSA